MKKKSNSFKLQAREDCFSWVKVLEVVRENPIPCLALVVSIISCWFASMSLKAQNENFELRNRPYIEIVNSNFRILSTGRYAWRNPLGPEPEFQLLWPVINHGPVPATISSIRIQAHRSLDKLKTEGIQIGPNEADRRWANWDIFPMLGYERNLDGRFRATSAFLNLEDVKRLFNIDLDKKQIVGEKEYREGIFNSDYLRESNNSLNNKSNFFILIQIKYYALGEIGRKKPYYYWVILEHHNREFIQLESGVHEAIKLSSNPKYEMEIGDVKAMYYGRLVSISDEKVATPPTVGVRAFNHQQNATGEPTNAGEM